MPDAYVECRPKSDNQTHEVTHHAVIVDEQEVRITRGRLEAEFWACAKGYAVHVARERHLQDRTNPAHWQKADCR